LGQGRNKEGVEGDEEESERDGGDVMYLTLLSSSPGMKSQARGSAALY